ncbi:sugar phosphate isomerase/epimerase family protein [Hypericibacter sp.]|uniref:sugar phosphate isomerase/epimerase family protein n=1 Tax=Hypericibacter sp. TaxID=2705401 RepID=UPI003D6CF3CB
MRIGVFSDSLAKLGRRDLFAWCAKRGITDIELGVGAWGPWPRPHLDLVTVGERAERDRLAGQLREYGIRLGAVNAAGNLLHPDPAKRADAQARFKAAVELAVAMGVDRVITMSGCPAGAAGGALGVFPCWATSADDERLFTWQLEHEVGPFWRQTSDWLAQEAPEVMVCLEMHPGVTIFSSAGFEALLPYIGRNVGLNMDPSHFWWQGIDPVTVVEAFGDRIGWSHGKDTILYPDRIRRHGVLHFAPPADPSQAPWHFASVGEGHDDATWVTLFNAMRAAGYDGVISIEHEDPRYDGEEGTQRSVDGLRRALGRLEAAA